MLPQFPFEQPENRPLETDPAAVRLLPPRWPPAPPSTGEGGGWGRFDPDPENRFEQALLAGRKHAEAVRVALEGIELAAGDPGRSAELQIGLYEATATLRVHLELLREDLACGRMRLTSPRRNRFQTGLLDIVSRGVPLFRLAERFEGDTFVPQPDETGQSEGEEPRFRYSFHDEYPLELLERCHPGAFPDRVIQDLLDTLEPADCRACAGAFTRDFYRKFLAVLWVWHESSGLMGPTELFSSLVEGLADLAIIRTTFETLSVFPGDIPLQDELQPIAKEAGASLARRLRQTSSELRATLKSADWALHSLAAEMQMGMDLPRTRVVDGFTQTVLQAAEQGVETRFLRAMLKTDVFDPPHEASDETQRELERYFLPPPPDATWDELRQLSPTELPVRLIDDLARAAEDPTSYTDRRTFDLTVSCRLVFLAYAALMASEGKW